MVGWHLYIIQIYNTTTCTLNCYYLYKLTHILYYKVCNFLIYIKMIYILRQSFSNVMCTLTKEVM